MPSYNDLDYYKILGVARDATQQEIRSAYLKRSLMYHPDKYNSDTEEGFLEKEFNEIVFLKEEFKELDEKALKKKLEKIKLVDFLKIIAEQRVKNLNKVNVEKSKNKEMEITMEQFLKDLNEDRFKKVNAAYKELSDADKRHDYDQWYKFSRHYRQSSNENNKSNQQSQQAQQPHPSKAEAKSEEGYGRYRPEERQYPRYKENKEPPKPAEKPEQTNRSQERYEATPNADLDKKAIEAIARAYQGKEEYPFIKILLPYLENDKDKSLLDFIRDLDADNESTDKKFDSDPEVKAFIKSIDAETLKKLRMILLSFDKLPEVKASEFVGIRLWDLHNLKATWGELIDSKNKKEAQEAKKPIQEEFDQNVRKFAEQFKRIPKFNTSNQDGTQYSDQLTNLWAIWDGLENLIKGTEESPQLKNSIQIAKQLQATALVEIDARLEPFRNVVRKTMTDLEPNLQEAKEVMLAINSSSLPRLLEEEGKKEGANAQIGPLLKQIEALQTDVNLLNSDVGRSRMNSADLLNHYKALMKFDPDYVANLSKDKLKEKLLEPLVAISEAPKNNQSKFFLALFKPKSPTKIAINKTLKSLKWSNGQKSKSTFNDVLVKLRLRKPR